MGLPRPSSTPIHTPASLETDSTAHGLQAQSLRFWPLPAQGSAHCPPRWLWMAGKDPAKKPKSAQLPPRLRADGRRFAGLTRLTSDDPRGEVDLDNASAECRSHHSQGCKEATHKHDRPAAKAIHTDTAEWSCVEKVALSLSGVLGAAGPGS